MRTNVVLDDALVDEAFSVSDAKTKRELIDRALREFVAKRRRKDLMELFGSNGMDPDYDHKRARSGDE